MKDERLKSIEASVNEIHALCGKIGDLSPTEELMQLIRKPGWTTLPEMLFTEGMLDGIRVQAEAIIRLRGALLAAAREVEPNPSPW